MIQRLLLWLTVRHCWACRREMVGTGMLFSVRTENPTAVVAAGGVVLKRTNIYFVVVVVVALLLQVFFYILM